MIFQSFENVIANGLRIALFCKIIAHLPARAHTRGKISHGFIQRLTFFGCKLNFVQLFFFYLHTAFKIVLYSDFQLYPAVKCYTQAVCDYVLERLEYHNLIDDAAYCRAYINSVKGKGKRALEADLIKRGAEKNAISEALDEVEEDSGEAAVILEKYMRGKQHDKQNLYKAFKYLLAKGYGYDTAKDALGKFGDTDEDY